MGNWRYEMSDDNIDEVLEYLKKHNKTIEELLSTEQGRIELSEFVNNELALFGFILAEEEGETLPVEEDNKETGKKRFIEKAKEFFKNHGKSIGETLFKKINDVVKDLLLPSIKESKSRGLGM
jgi:hypothetical protein